MKIIDIIKIILSSPITLTVVIFFFSLCVFDCGIKSVNTVKKHSRKLSIIFSAVIAIAFTALEYFFYDKIPPFAGILILAFSFWCTVRVFTKDSFYIYLYLFLAVIFVISVAGECYIPIISVPFANFEINMERENLFPLITLNFLFSLFYLIFLTRSRTFQLENFKLLIHSGKRGKFLFYYFIGFDIFLMFATFSEHTLLLSHELNEVGQMSFFVIELFKDVIIVASSFYIIYTQCRLEATTIEKNQSVKHLNRERMIRNSGHRNKLMEYMVDTSTNTIIDGEKTFFAVHKKFSDPNLANKIHPKYLSYTENIKLIAQNFIHPDDIDVLDSIGTEKFYKDKLEISPFYSFRFRISTVNVADILNFKNEAKEILLSHQKEWIYAAASCTVFTDEETGHIFLHVEIDDVDNEVNRELSLLASASHDALTGILNRRGAEEKINMYLEKGIYTAALFIIDLDNFKTVNDEMGHPEGDKLLYETANILKHEFRSDDVVSRLGGDEFMVFAFELSDYEMIKSRAERICNLLEKTLYAPNGKKIVVSASIGIALYPNNGTNYSTLYANADSALYESKRTGKNKYSLIN